jgi:putative hydrolase of the HAD superfamily
VAASEIDVVLFDLGGVLIDFRGVEPMKALAGIEHDDELWERWLTCEWVRRFERGQCEPLEFATGVVEDWRLTVAPEDFIASFRTWPGGPFAGADDLLQQTRSARPVGCLSNTNALHWDDQFSQWPILDAFDYRFLSYELGVLKPDREVFDHVAERLPAPRERVLFLDDNRLNVEGATAAGFRTARVQGVDEARAALVAAGVLR